MSRTFFMSMTALFAWLPGLCLAQPLPDENQPFGMASLTSEHFVVRFPENTERFARRTIDYAEYAYRLLSQRFETEIDGRITIQLLDRIDNDETYKPSADFSDFFLIYLWPSQSILENAYHGAWLEEEISAHIARLLVQRTHVDFIHSYNNVLLPAWYLDGISSYWEIPEHPGDAFRHGMRKALIRHTARHHAFPKLEMLTAGSQTWLGDEIGKIYGTAFIDYIVQRFDLSALTRWNHENAASFSRIDEIAVSLFGENWQTLYAQWIDHWQADYEDAPDEGLFLDKDYISGLWRNELPQVVPNANAVSYVRDNGSSPRSIVLYDLESGRETWLAECHGRCEHHWSPDGRTLYYSSRTRMARYESESLYSLHLDDYFPRKLPVPGHVRSFAVDDQSILLATLNGDQPVIYRYDIASGSAVAVFTGKPFSMIEGISVIGDNQWVAAVYDPDDRRFDLASMTLHRDKLDITPVTNDDITEMYPFRLSDGRIGYITDKNGFYVLNAVRPDGSGRQIVYTSDNGMIQPVQAGDGTLYYTDVTYQGMGIARLTPDKLYGDESEPGDDEFLPSFLGPRLPLWIRSPLRLEALEMGDFENTSGLLSRSHEQGEKTFSVDVTDNPVVPVASEYYNGPDWSVLIPDSYIPMFGLSDATGWYLGLGIENYDYLQHHFYHLHFAWFFDRDNFDLEFTYKWSRYSWWIAGSIVVLQKTQTIDLGQSYRYLPHMSYQAYLATGSAWHYPYLNIEFSLKALAEYTKTNDDGIKKMIDEWFGPSPKNNTPMDLYELWSNALIATLKLSHIHSVPQSIPGQTGYQFSLESRIETPFFGNRSYTFANKVNLDMSWSMPWRSSEVLAMSFFYGFAWSESDYRYPLELLSASGFSFNDMVDFHGIRAGNLIANNHLMHGQIKYTIPIVVIKQNQMKIPFAFNRIGVGALGDWALGSDKYYKPNIESSMLGIGAEIYIDATIGYNYPLHIGFGMEKGFADAGEDSYYLWLKM